MKQNLVRSIPPSAAHSHDDHTYSILEINHNHGQDGVTCNPRSSYREWGRSVENPFPVDMMNLDHPNIMRYNLPDTFHCVKSGSSPNLVGPVERCGHKSPAYDKGRSERYIRFFAVTPAGRVLLKIFAVRLSDTTERPGGYSLRSSADSAQHGQQSACCSSHADSLHQPLHQPLHSFLLQHFTLQS